MTANFADLYEPLVEWVYDHADDKDLGDVEFSEFSQRHGLNFHASYRLLRYCKERGLLDDRFSTMDEPSANLTPVGIRWVEERRRRRTDPALRAAAARKGLLTWLWKRKQEGVQFPVVDHVLDTEESLFEGERLRSDEIDRAAEYLARKGLITGASVYQRRGPVRAETTPEGDDCVEHYGGDVSEYEQRHAQASGPVFHIHGNNTGNIAANSRDFKMHATTANGVDLAAVVMFARALRQALPILDLPDAEAEELAETADRMEQEASGENPDANRLQRWRRSTVDMLSSAVVSGALGSVLAAYGETVLPGL